MCLELMYKNSGDIAEFAYLAVGEEILVNEIEEHNFHGDTCPGEYVSAKNGKNEMWLQFVKNDNPIITILMTISNSNLWEFMYTEEDEDVIAENLIDMIVDSTANLSEENIIKLDDAQQKSEFLRWRLTDFAMHNPFNSDEGIHVLYCT